MKTDFHLHTEFSPDSSTPMDDIIAGAIRERVDEICITDHLDIGDPFEPYFKYTTEDYIEHFKKIDECAKKYAGIITIKKGMEIGYISGFEKENENFVGDNSLDFVIGSIHNLGEMDYYIADNDPDDFIKIEKLYLEKIIGMIDAVDYFSVLGHMNYPCKFFGFREKLFTYKDFSDHLDEIFKKLVQKGKGIEINTSCLKTEGAFEALLPVIKKYKELGGEIVTIGSDSHDKKFVAYNFEKAQAMLLQAGFNYLSTFEKLQPAFHVID